MSRVLLVLVLGLLEGSGMKLMVDPSAPDHPKIWRLAKLLNLDRVTAWGHLSMLWCTTMRLAEGGALTGWEPEAVARAADWRGKPETFMVALKEAGLLDGQGDGGLTLHDWQDHQGDLIKRRARDRERKRIPSGFRAESERNPGAPAVPCPAVPLPAIPSPAVPVDGAENFGTGEPGSRLETKGSSGSCPKLETPTDQVAWRLALLYSKTHETPSTWKVFSCFQRPANAGKLKLGDLERVMMDPANAADAPWELIKKAMRPSGVTLDPAVEANLEKMFGKFGAGQEGAK